MKDSEIGPVPQTCPARVYYDVKFQLENQKTSLIPL